METSVVTLLITVIVVTLYYLMPLLTHRLKTKKVKIIVVDLSGEKKTNVLYLYPDDPLWEIVKTHKGSHHA